MADEKNTTNSDLIKLRRSQILKAAEKVFGEKGYHNTNIADIAAELKIGHGTFYRYFKNKRDIFEQVIEEVIQRVIVIVSSEDPTSTSSLEEYRRQVVRIGEKLMALFLENPALANLVFYESWGLDEELRQKVWRMMDVFGGFTELYLIHCKEKGFLRPDLDTETTALSINLIIFEAARRIARSSSREEDMKRWIGSVIALMFDGVGRR